MEKIMEEKALNLKKFLEVITSENIFVWIIGAIIITFWAVDLWIIGLLLICIMIAGSLFFYKDTSRVLAILFMFVLIISANRHKLGGFSYILFVSIGLLLLGIITHLIRFKPKFRHLFTEKKS